MVKDVRAPRSLFGTLRALFLPKIRKSPGQAHKTPDKRLLIISLHQFQPLHNPSIALHNPSIIQHNPSIISASIAGCRVPHGSLLRHGIAYPKKHAAHNLPFQKDHMRQNTTFLQFDYTFVTAYLPSKPPRSAWHALLPPLPGLPQGAPSATGTESTKHS